jgi:hypothetical protein
MNLAFAQLVKFLETHHAHVDQVRSLSVATEAQLKFK